MKHLEIKNTPVEINLPDFSLHGDLIESQYRWIKNLKGIFWDESEFKKTDQEKLAYKVQCWFPVDEGTPSGLFFGTSTIFPGKVGKEYFMTKGHFHQQSDRAEFYWGVKGKGILILMDRKRNTWAEEVYPGSLHYISDNIAHRLANTGAEELVVGACWPSDAGHDYEEIAKNGFSARLVEVNEKPVLISNI